MNVDDIKDDLKTEFDGPGLTADVRRAAEVAKSQKARLIKRVRDAALSTAVMALRGGEPVAILQLNGYADRDAGLLMAEVAAFGYDADVIVFVTDSYFTTTENNPLTGERWGPKEMQRVAEEHDGIAKGWVQEGLHVIGVNRAGDHRSWQLPYRIAGRRVEWLEDFNDKPKRTGGLVVDALRDAMNRGSLSSKMAELGALGSMFGMDYVEARARMDAVATKFVFEKVENCSVAMCYTAGSRAEQIYREHFPGGRIVRP